MEVNQSDSQPAKASDPGAYVRTQLNAHTVAFEKVMNEMKPQVIESTKPLFKQSHPIPHVPYVYSLQAPDYWVRISDNCRSLLIADNCELWLKRESESNWILWFRQPNDVEPNPQPKRVKGVNNDHFPPIANTGRNFYITDIANVKQIQKFVEEGHKRVHYIQDQRHRLELLRAYVRQYIPIGALEDGQNGRVFWTQQIMRIISDYDQLIYYLVLTNTHPSNICATILSKTAVIELNGVNEVMAEEFKSDHSMQ